MEIKSTEHFNTKSLISGMYFDFFFFLPSGQWPLHCRPVTERMHALLTNAEVQIMFHSWYISQLKKNKN